MFSIGSSAHAAESFPVLGLSEERGDRRADLYWFGLYAGFVLFTWTLVLSYPKPYAHEAFYLTIGGIAIWRYGWWSLHQLRALVFLKLRFPYLREQANAAAERERLEHLYVVVMSYKIPPLEFESVYRALIENAIDYDVPTTIVASVTSDADRRLLNKIFLDLGRPWNIEILVQFQKGDGKRSAIGMALRAISRREPPSNSVTILMDGDILLEPSAIARSVSFFLANPKLAGATTNNGAIVDGSYVARNWYILRHAQRHALMSSMALSKRLLVLTGRYSLIRTHHVVDPGFIDRVENDSISHWRLGTFRFVSGDDKSTWYHLMTKKAEMLYIPDVFAHGFESLPSRESFLLSSTQLMSRWFGNMLRTNGRAIALGPFRCGFFVWWSLIDQRISIWTTLVGPAATAMFVLLISPIYLVYYLAWAAFTRSVMAAAAGIAYGRASFSWPFLIYYNQLWGSLLKTFLWFRLNRQGWTRQKIGTSGRASALEGAASVVMQLTAYALLFLVVGVVTGVISVPGAGAVLILADDLQRPSGLPQ